MPDVADHSFLLGFLALRMGFVDREAVVRAASAWAAEPSRSLVEVLVEHGALAESQRGLLEMAAENYLRRYGESPDAPAGEAGPTIGAIVPSEIEPAVTTALRGSSTGTPDLSSVGRVGERSSAGRFRVVRPHASGGLGAVFLARDEELGREVALKEIHPWLAHDLRLRERFVLEAEITGALEHPGIVPVYGLGRYEDDRPFYAMRFIRGESLMEAIERFHNAEEIQRDEAQRGVALRKLLNSFVAVCNTVGYAHSRGVIHRDLKPENVMLGPYGETLVVDWGLAKLVGRPNEDGLSETALSPASAGGLKPTQLGSTLGTVFYMSPEQAAGQVGQLGPATDIYALGAMLYVILTCKPPFEGTECAEVLDRVIAGRFARPRQADPRVPAALDAICLKAMAPAPADRYASATQVAGDVESWLADGPVSAWREPFRVRAGRWMRRHRPLVSGMTAALLVAVVSLAAGVFLLASANNQIRHAQSLAESRGEEARGNLKTALGAVDNFYVRVSEDPRLRAHNLEPLRRGLLEAAVGFYQQFTREKPEDPALRYLWAAANFRLADILADIDTEPHAIQTLHRAVEVLEPLVEEYPDSAQYKSMLVKCRINLGIDYFESGRLEEARAAYQAAMAINDQLVALDPASADDQVDRASLHNDLGKVELATGRLDAAEAEFRRAVAIRRALADRAPENDDYQASLANNEANLGAVLQRQGRLAEAAKAMEAARRVQERLVQRHGDLPEYRHDLAATCGNLAQVYGRLPGRTSDAAAAFKEALAALRRLVEEHPDVVQYQFELGKDGSNLVAFYEGRGRLTEALTACKEAVQVERRLVAEHGDVPGHHYALAAALNNLGILYCDAQRPEDGETACREAIGIDRALVRQHPDLPDYRNGLANACQNLARCLTALGRAAEADAAYREGIANLESLAKRHPQTAAYVVQLGAAYTRLANILADRPEAALAAGRKAIAILRADPALAGRDPSAKSFLISAHGLTAEALGRLHKYPESLAEWDAALALASGGGRDPLRLGRAEALLHLGKYAQAAAEAKQLAPATRGAGQPSYQLAAVFSLACGAAAKDSSLPAGERKRLADQYAASAFDLLNQAKAAGYFRSPAQRKALRDDPALEAIRSRPEFKKLLTSIGSRRS